MSGSRIKALRDAALLRNRIESCLRAAAAPMTGRELADWPSVKEVIGDGPAAYGKVSGQITNLIKHGQLERIGSGNLSSYVWVKTTPQPETSAQPFSPPVYKQLLSELNIRINKKEKTLHFIFEGLSISIEVI